MALKDIAGFQWLTHVVDYSNFPQSLEVICIFDTDENLYQFAAENSQNTLSTHIQSKLNEIDIKVKNIATHIVYDTEERCDIEHHGNWAERIAK